VATTFASLCGRGRPRSWTASCPNSQRSAKHHPTGSSAPVSVPIPVRARPRAQRRDFATCLQPSPIPATNGRPITPLATSNVAATFASLCGRGRPRSGARPRWSAGRPSANIGGSPIRSSHFMGVWGEARIFVPQPKRSVAPIFHCRAGGGLTTLKSTRFSAGAPGTIPPKPDIIE
jgi:hypothetical protein